MNRCVATLRQVSRLGQVCLAATVWSCLVAALPAAPTPSPTPVSTDDGVWAWEAPIQATTATATTADGARFVQVPLPPAVLDEAQPSFADVRVQGPDGQFVPRLVRFASRVGVRVLAWKPVDVADPVYRPSEYARATLDLGQPTPKNQLKVGVTGASFRRRAMVEGSADGKAWELLADDLYLFAYDLPERKIRVDVLHLPTNDFRYLRLTVYPTGDDREPFEIESAATALTETRDEARIALPHAPATVTHDETQHETDVEFDLGFRHLSLEAIRLAVADAQFCRAYVLEGRDSLTEKVPAAAGQGTAKSGTVPPSSAKANAGKAAAKSSAGPGTEQERETPWIRLHDGVIYRIVNGNKAAESLEIGDVTLTSRYLRLRIFDQDGSPLDVAPDDVAVSWRQPALIFEQPAGEPCTLRWGNPQARSPEYDLAAAHPNLILADMPVVRLYEARSLAGSPAAVAGHAVKGTKAAGATQPSRTPRSSQVSEDEPSHHYLLFGFLAVMVAGVAVVVVRSLLENRRR